MISGDFFDHLFAPCADKSSEVRYIIDCCYTLNLMHLLLILSLDSSKFNKSKKSLVGDIRATNAIIFPVIPNR